MTEGEAGRAERKKELHRVVVARSDINLALQGCEVLLAHVESFGSDFYMPLLNAVAISYARPFKRSKPVGALSLEWHKFSDSRLQNVHNMLIETRDTYVAHSDRSVRKVMIVPPGANVPGIGIAPSLSVTVGIVIIPFKRFREVRELCMDLGRRLNTAVETLLKELYGERSLPTEPFPLEFNEEL